ncbi:MAG TPA: LCP family protein [Anaerolineales bacterium]|nr:LCP family protein [Anaerolineales bacterium]
MTLFNRKPSYELRRVTSLFCWVLLLSLVLGCGALTQINPPTATATHSITPTSTVTQTSTPTISPTPTERPVLCGGPPAMFILLVGSDARRDSYAVGLADSMRIVRVDFIEPGIQVLTFPRDLYVEIPDIEDHNGITRGKLNQAYLYGNPGYNYYDGPGQGPGLLASTLAYNFDARVDHYFAVNLQTFVRIVDTLGGIDITLPYVIDGRVRGSRDPNRYFAAGDQHLNGYRTMLLARLRPQGDFRRIEVQNLLLQAFAEKLLSPSAILKLPELIEGFSESVQTDLGPVEIGQLLCLRARLDTQEIEFGNFPENLFQSARVRDPVLGNTSILEVDFDLLKTFVRSFNNGTWPQSHVDPRDQVIP